MFARRMFQGLLSAAVWLGPAVAVSQGTVAGTVTDGRVGTPIAGARVQALTATSVVAATQSREDGTFRLTVAAGSYTIVVNRVGYQAGRVDVTVTDGGTTTADVKMSETFVMIDRTVVTASRSQEKALDAPASVAVIDVREIQERPAVTAADHVQGLAGVNVSKGASPSRTSWRAASTTRSRDRSSRSRTIALRACPRCG